MSIELKPFCNEAEIAIADGGLILTLTMDFGVIDRLEGLLKRPMDELIGDLFTSVATQVKFLWAMTRKHHSDVTLDQAAGILLSKDGQPVIALLGQLVRTTFNYADEGEGEQSSRPPRHKAKSASRGASSGSAGSGLRRALTRTPSGRKPRARS